jgi:putative aldouronate transport system permease protein
MLTTEGDIVNELIKTAEGKEVNFLTESQYFRPLIVCQSIWRETGWGTIIFFAVPTSIDPQLYDSALVDGANVWQRLWTISAVTGTIVTLLILRLGHSLDTSFTRIFMMVNSLNRSVGEVFDRPNFF